MSYRNSSVLLFLFLKGNARPWPLAKFLFVDQNPSSHQSPREFSHGPPFPHFLKTGAFPRIGFTMKFG